MISKLHIITQPVDGFDELSQIKALAEGGADWIQLRLKGVEFDEWLSIAKESVSICRKFNVKIIINDNVEIALRSGADGVHLGKSDLSPVEARKILGADAIIGGTANTIDDILGLVKMGVDYVGVGPFRYTTTKDNLSPILGLDGYRSILEREITVPIIAIGGLTVDDVASLKEVGVYGVAISGDIIKSDNIKDKIFNYTEAL